MIIKNGGHNVHFEQPEDYVRVVNGIIFKKCMPDDQEFKPLSTDDADSIYHLLFLLLMKLNNNNLIWSLLA